VIEVFLVLLIVGGLIALVATRGRGGRTSAASALSDAEAEARRWYERLGGQVLSLTGSDDASRQAIADAAERYTAAGSQLEQADSTPKYRLAAETALEGLYYVRAARVAMGMDPGPELPDSQDRRRAGSLVEDRQVEVGGRAVSGSPHPSAVNGHYYPGGVVQGRPVPAGWYSEPWWKPMLLGGAGAIGGILLADALFSGFGGGLDGGGFDGGGFDGGGGGFDQGGFDGGGGFDLGGW